MHDFPARRGTRLSNVLRLPIARARRAPSRKAGGANDPAFNFKGLALILLALRVIARSLLGHDTAAIHALADWLTPWIGHDAVALLVSPLAWAAPAVMNIAWAQIGFATALACNLAGAVMLRAITIRAGVSYRSQLLVVAIYALWLPSIIGAACVAPEAMLTPAALALAYMVQRMVSPRRSAATLAHI